MSDLPPDLKVVNFRPRKVTQEVQECSCSRQDFYLNQDKSIECRGCGLVMSKCYWVNGWDLEK